MKQRGRVRTTLILPVRVSVAASSVAVFNHIVASLANGNHTPHLDVTGAGVFGDDRVFGSYSIATTPPTKAMEKDFSKKYRRKP